MLTVLNGIGLGQPSTQDSCICYTDKQDKNCLECLINFPKREEQINNLSLQIINFKEILSKDKEQEKLHKERINALEKDLKITTVKLKISRKLTFVGVPVAFGAGILVSILLNNN